MYTACWPIKSGWQKQQQSTVWEAVAEYKEGGKAERGNLAQPHKLFCTSTVVSEIRGWEQLKTNGSLERSEQMAHQTLILTFYHYY
jgi:hypothetical protein